MNQAPAGARIATSFQGVHSGGLQLDTFFIGHDGGLYVAWVVGTGAWNAPFRITPANMAPPGAPVAAGSNAMIPLAVFPSEPAGTDAVGFNARLNVFFVGHDGALYVSSVVGVGQWEQPRRISDVGLAPPGAAVVAGPQTSRQLDVFFVGRDGAVYVAWAVDPDNHWHGPIRITPPAVAPAGAELALGYQGSNQLDVFFVGGNGALHVAWVVGTGAWAGPVGISPEGVAPPGARLVTGKQTPDQLDVFFVGNRGALNVSWVVGGGTWAGPIGISGDGVAAPGAGVASGMQTGQQMDVFFVGGNGALHVSWVVGTGNWAGPVAISPPGLSPAGGSPAVGYQTGNQLDVFLAGADRTVMWVTGTANWSGPFALPN